MTLTPYLNMTGTAEEALLFYQNVFGGTSEIHRWSEMPPDDKMPISDDWKDKIMHAALTISENVTIYLSDSWTDNKTPVNNTVFLHVTLDSEDTARAAFDALAAGGTVNMPMDRTFWGSIYGDVIDKFGIGWGIEHALPE